MDPRLKQMAPGNGLTRDEALVLANKSTPLDALMVKAAVLTTAFTDETVEFCSIVNARSGRCPNDCAFCAQSIHHPTDAPVFDLISVDRMVAASRAAAAAGARFFSLVTSGPSVSDADFERILEGVRAIATLGIIHPCASIGQLTPERARQLKEAGLMRYHHNLETSARFYPHVCTTQSYATRLETLRAAREAGLELCAGGLFGLGETWEDRIDMLISLREIGVESVPINFLNPIPGTPLSERATLPSDEALRIIAIARLLIPRASIRLCGGRMTALGTRQADSLRAGADALMIGHYLTTSGRAPEEDHRLVAELGRTIRTDSAL